jgi:NADH:ubiquinone reductase (H+-translocating)
MRSASPFRPGEAVETEGAGLVVLGAGYAGLTVAREVDRRAKGKIPIVLVDRNPVHVLRTELYEVGRLAASGGRSDGWTVPLARVFERSSVELRQASVEGIDLDARTVRTDTGSIPYRFLVICLGSVAAYYGVPGAPEFTHQVYRLSGAVRLAEALRGAEARSAQLPGERRPRVVVVGGGSTGTELAAEIATTDWEGVTGVAVRPPDVFLVVGALPFLAGFPPALIGHARDLLRKAGVAVIPGVNVARVEDGRVALEDGTVLPCDVAVWCAGLEAPPAVRSLPVPRTKAGRLQVLPTLEVPDRPGVFALGDSAEFRDPRTGMIAPATAQAALAEARTVAQNVVAQLRGEPPVPFTYREKGVALALGLGQGAATVRRLTVWGSPAALLKRAVQREYARAVERGEPSGVL